MFHGQMSPRQLTTHKNKNSQIEIGTLLKNESPPVSDIVPKLLGLLVTPPLTDRLSNKKKQSLE